MSSPEVIETPVAPPAIDFPAFPDPTDRVSVDDDGAVTMDADYWVSIAEYAIRVEAVREIYEGFRDIYGTE